MTKNFSNKKQELIIKNIGLAKSIAGRRNTLIYNEDTDGYAYYGLCKAADSFKPEKGYAFSTYAYRVINNCITEGINRMRLDTGNLHIWRNTGLKDRQELHSQVTKSEFFKIIPVEDTIEDDIYSKQIKNLVLKYLNKLPDGERKVLEMRYAINDTWRKYTRGEVAKELNISLPTVDRWEKKGIARLKRWIKNDGGIDVYA